MKKIFVIIAFTVSMTASAQSSHILNGNTFVTVKKERVKQKKDTLITQYKYHAYDHDWTIIINKKTGACWYYIVEADGHKKFRYCPSDVSDQVASKLGITRVKRNKTTKK